VALLVPYAQVGKVLGPNTVSLTANAEPPFTHNAIGLAVASKDIGKFTATVTVVLAVLQLASVPITVYVVVAVGLAVTEAPVAAESVAAGAQLYVLAPLAERELLVTP
jgi:hypothetical protein